MQSIASLIVGDRQWLWPAVAIAVVGVGWAIIRNRSSSQMGLATVFRSMGWLLISLCLINPL